MNAPAFRLPSPAWRLGPPLVMGLAALLIHLAGWNQPLFLWLNRLGTALPAGFWSAVTLLGDTLVALVLLLPFARRWPQVVWALLLAAVSGSLFVHGLKPALDLPRPPAVLEPDQFRLVGHMLRGRSFPSGHAFTAFTLAGVWAMTLGRGGAVAALWCAAALVALSRVMVGVHWPVDVLAGGAAGWLNAWLGVALARRWPWGLTRAGRALALVLLTACALALFFHDGGYPAARWLAWALAGLGLASGLRALWSLWRE